MLNVVKQVINKEISLLYASMLNYVENENELDFLNYFIEKFRDFVFEGFSYCFLCSTKENVGIWFSNNNENDLTLENIKPVCLECSQILNDYMKKVAFNDMDINEQIHIAGNLCRDSKTGRFIPCSDIAMVLGKEGSLQKPLMRIKNIPYVNKQGVGEVTIHSAIVNKNVTYLLIQEAYNDYLIFEKQQKTGEGGTVKKRGIARRFRNGILRDLYKKYGSAFGRCPFCVNEAVKAGKNPESVIAQKLERHHIKGKAINDPKNLISICRTHHDIVHAELRKNGKDMEYRFVFGVPSTKEAVVSIFNRLKSGADISELNYVISAKGES